MISSENELLNYLEAHSIPYERIEHPPVYTCEQAAPYRAGFSAAPTKNLFLANKGETNYYLVMTLCEKRVDLKALAAGLGEKRLHFGLEADVQAMLGVTPGAVTVLALINDTAHRIHLYIDGVSWDSPAFLCHPLVNTASLLIAKPDMERFFALSGHPVHIIP